jgi:hypothetical protein
MSNVKPLSPAQRKRMATLKAAHDAAEREMLDFGQYLMEEHEIPATEEWRLDLAAGAWVRVEKPVVKESE